MANKKDLKSSMAHGLNSGLDSLIQPTTKIQEPEQLQKERAVHCNFVINQSIHTRLKTLAIRRGITLKEAIQEAALEYLNKYE
jgi:rRNA-processing protein FCF1